MCFNINLLNLILIPPRSVDLQARHRQPLINEKPLVIHQRKGLEVQYHLRNDAHMGGLSSWVSVDPVHGRLWDIRQDLNNRNTKMKKLPTKAPDSGRLSFVLPGPQPLRGSIEVGA